MKKIVISTGGTGGHIFPAINLMKHFYEKKYDVLLVTDSRGNKFLKDKHEFKSYILKTTTPFRKNFIVKILSFFTIFYSIINSIIILKKEKPNLIIGLGGYVSFPLCFSAGLLNLPLVIYENNMVMGRTNKYLSFFSKKILLGKDIKKNLPKKYHDKIYEVGPILNKIFFDYSQVKIDKNIEEFSILVLGGSQGAEIFGKIIPSVIKMLKDQGYKIEIVQQCLPNQKKIINDFYKKNNIKNYVFEFDNDLLKLFLSANLAIARCGASSTAELMQTFTPFIAVPLPNSADNHQYLNAKYYENKGCCWLVEQDSFNKENLYNLIMDVIKNKNKLENIRENMKKNCKSHVYEEIEEKIKEYI